MAITASGIGSGIDVASLVSQLVAAEGKPAAFRLDNKEARLQSDLSAYGTLKGALSKFQESVKALNDLKSFQQRSSVSSKPELFSATADITAVAGTYNIEVVQLAQAAKMRSGDGEFTSATDIVGTGTLAISLGSDSFQITIDSSNQTLEGIRDAINSASDNPGISASIISVDGGTQLVFASNKIGAENTIDIVATDDDGADGFDLSRLATASLDTVQSAQDAIIKVDQQQVTRGSNTFSDVIQGVSFTLKKADVGTTETLTVALNTDSVKGKVNTFVAAYNSLVETMKTLSSYDADAGKSSGPLIGDSILRGVQSQVRQALSSSVDGLTFGTLAEIGVKTNKLGKLEINSEKLDKVLASDFGAVAQLFSSENGLANSLSKLLDRYVDTDGVLNAKTKGIKTSISSVGDDREKLGIRLTALEARYKAQFTAMDMLVGQLQSLGTYLGQQLASLPEPNSVGRRR